MFSRQISRLEGIEDIFSGALKFATTQALPLYTQYQNLQLLKKQSEFQKQIEQAITPPLPTITAQPGPVAKQPFPWGILVLGGGGLFLAYTLLIPGGKGKK